MLITLTPDGTGRREEVALQIQEVAPIDSRGGPPLCSMWHFALRVDPEVNPTDSRGGPTDSRGGPTDSRGGPHHVCGVALCSVWVMDSRGAPTDSRGGPYHVCGVTLCSVWHLVPFRISRTLARLWDTSSSSRH